MFGPKKEGNVFAGISLTIVEENDSIIVNAKCKKSEVKYLLHILNDRLGHEAEQSGAVSHKRLRAKG